MIILLPISCVALAAWLAVISQAGRRMVGSFVSVRRYPQLGDWLRALYLIPGLSLLLFCLLPYARNVLGREGYFGLLALLMVALLLFVLLARKPYQYLPSIIISFVPSLLLAAIAS